MKKIKSETIVFIIVVISIGITNYCITQDWSSTLFRCLLGGLLAVIIYGIGFSNGVRKGEANGYDKAIKDLKPLLPEELPTDKDMNE